jgi:hypothetical protein
MSLPEISRRCLSCGAAVRAGTRFCPQCGKPFEAEERPAAEHEAEPARAPVPTTGEWSPQEQAAPPTTKEWAPPTREFAAFAESSKVIEPPSSSPPPPAPVAVSPSNEEVEPEAAVAPESGEAEADEAARAGDLRGRVARVREGTRARVGRMREEAIVVLEETPDDSGLRFVLAAAALFVVFLVLLFLSTTLLR